MPTPSSSTNSQDGKSGSPRPQEVHSNPRTSLKSSVTEPTKSVNNEPSTASLLQTNSDQNSGETIRNSCKECDSSENKGICEHVCQSKSDTTKDASKEDRKMNLKTQPMLEKMSYTELKVAMCDLTEAVKDISSELVCLLQENDTLQQESDARKIAIEQLLKLTVKQTETELRPVQMSVVIPDVSSDDEWV